MTVSGWTETWLEGSAEERLCCCVKALWKQAWWPQKHHAFSPPLRWTFGFAMFSQKRLQPQTGALVPWLRSRKLHPPSGSGEGGSSSLNLLLRSAEAFTAR